MENLPYELRISHADPSINAILAAGVPDARDVPYRMRFNQNEEYFIEVDTPLSVPALPIHHDVRQSKPEADYVGKLSGVVLQLVQKLPSAFAGLSYFFDPADILKPSFFHLYKVESNLYLYVLKIDLLFRSFEMERTQAGTNDMTPSYNTRRVFLESELIPLHEVVWSEGQPKAFLVQQYVSQTWIGETGKGYQVRGIWMDADLTKFFTKLFMPAGKRHYPFFPFFCKYKSICGFVPALDGESRKKTLPLLHRAIGFLAPEMERIQAALRHGSFSETLPEFTELIAKIPSGWRDFHKEIAIEPYLNERDQKEYSLAYVQT